MPRPAVQLGILHSQLARENTAVVQGCVPFVSIAGDSYRMRRHRDAINTIRPALSTRPQGGEFP
jgi:hypothetical protein